MLVRFHTQYICEQASQKAIQNALEKLKSSSIEECLLDLTYDRAMNSIRGQSKSLVELALKVLSWLVKAKRTLTVEELRATVSVKQKHYKLDESDLSDPTTLVDICAGLVVKDEHSNTIRLAHYSVQEYLLRNSILPQDADFQLAMVCTTYLSFDTLA